MEKKLRSTKYTKDRILNPDFDYTHSSKTDIAETFRRILEKREAEVKQHQVIKFKGK